MTNKKFVINTILSCPLLDRLGCNCQSQAKIIEAAADELILFPPQKSTFSPQSICYPLFLNKDGRILTNGRSKLHYRFRRYSTLPKTVLLESQYLQSYDDLVQILAKENQEDCHNFADIEIQAKLS